MTRAQRGPVPAGPDDVVYLFAHETLGAVAEETLGNDLGPYRRRLDGWADGYRERGWPAEHPAVPAAAVRDAARRQGQGDLRRLVDLATDPRRHDRLLAATLGDGDAIAELTTAQKLRARAAGARPGDPGTARGPPRPPGEPQRAPAGRAARPAGAPGPAPPGRGDRQGHAHAPPAQGAGRRRRRPRRRRPVGTGGADTRARSPTADARAEGAGRGGQGDDRGGPGAGPRPAGGGRARSPGASPIPHLRPFAMAAVAEAFAGAGLWERAERTAHAIEPMYAAAGARALRSVVGALAADGPAGTAPSGPRAPFPASGKRPRPWPRWAPP